MKTEELEKLGFEQTNSNSFHIWIKGCGEIKYDRVFDSLYIGGGMGDEEYWFLIEDPTAEKTAKIIEALK